MSASAKKWLSDIAGLLPVSSQFVVTGGVRDSFLYRGLLVPADVLIWRELRAAGFRMLLRWAPWRGLEIVQCSTDLPPAMAEMKQAFSTSAALRNWPATARTDDQKRGELTGILAEWPPAPGGNSELDDVALLVDCSGNPDEVLGPSVFTQAERLDLAYAEGQDGKSCRRPIFWLTPNINDVPHWFLAASDRIRQIAVPGPDRSARFEAAAALFPMFEGAAARDAGAAEAFASQLAELTHGMTLNAIDGIVRLAIRRDIAPDHIKLAIDWYRLGDTSNTRPWELRELHESIANAEATISQAVKGQADAIRAVSDMLKRIYRGLSGAQTPGGGANRPRGVLFFAGPTGVGKTETAKRIASLIFGDEEHYLRFDMSEFSAEHSGDRLIGAPPGYVGFNQGGELTNAIRENPFRVILFDEIEKAHPLILDKFLQILEDGRLTDGRGGTVYFTDCLLIFTSNLGMYEETLKDGVLEKRKVVRYGDPATDVRRKLLEGVKAHFEEKLGRPDLLTRIGQNIVVFDFIGEDAAGEIVSAMVENVRARLANDGIALSYSPEFIGHLRAICISPGVMDQGGRGISSKIEQLVVNPLSRFLFDHDVTRGQHVELLGIGDGESGGLIARRPEDGRSAA
jgi:hypothetical protein